MASSFNSLFGPNFLQGLSQNQNPDPTILPGVQPAGEGAPSNALQAALTPETYPQYQQWIQAHGIKPSEDYDTYAAFKAGVQPSANGHLDDAYKRPNHVTYSEDSLASQQPGAPPAGKWLQTAPPDQAHPNGVWTFQAAPTNIANAGGIDGMKKYFDANEPGNTVALPNGEVYTGQAAPQPPQNPTAPGQPAAPVATAPMLGQTAPLPQPVMPAHGERKSFASVLQSLSDKVNTSFGQPTTAQIQQAQQLRLQAAMLDNQAKNQDITQTGLENQTTANGVIGNFARGLAAIQAAGADPAIAAPELARQLGIPTNQAQAIMDAEKRQPGFLKTLAENADKADKAEKFAMALTSAVDKDGKPVFVQPGSAGTVKVVDGYTPLPQTSSVDSGDATHIINKNTGKDVRTITKQGGPATGEGAITGPDGTVTGYRPLPGSKASDEHQKTQADIEKLRQEAADREKKAQADAAAKSQAAAGIRANIATINSSIDELERLGAQPGPDQNMVGNISNYLQGTKVGQAVTHFTNPKVAQARDAIAAAGQALLVAASHGNGQLFRNQAEQKAFQAAVNNPQSSIQVMRQALKNLQVQLVAPTPAAPASRTPRPAATSGWGKAQVVQ